MEDQIKPGLVKVPSHFSVTDVVSVTGGGGHTLIITGHMSDKMPNVQSCITP